MSLVQVVRSGRDDYGAGPPVLSNVMATYTVANVFAFADVRS